MAEGRSIAVEPSIVDVCMIVALSCVAINRLPPLLQSHRVNETLSSQPYSAYPHQSTALTALTTNQLTSRSVIPCSKKKKQENPYPPKERKKARRWIGRYYKKWVRARARMPRQKGQRTGQKRKLDGKGRRVGIGKQLVDWEGSSEVAPCESEGSTFCWWWHRGVVTVVVRVGANFIEKSESIDRWVKYTALET